MVSSTVSCAFRMARKFVSRSSSCSVPFSIYVPPRYDTVSVKEVTDAESFEAFMS